MVRDGAFSPPYYGRRSRASALRAKTVTMGRAGVGGALRWRVARVVAARDRGGVLADGGVDVPPWKHFRGISLSPSVRGA